MTDVRQAVALAHANLSVKKRLRASTLAAIGLAWDRLGTYYGPDIKRFVALAVPLVAGAQRQVAATTDAYLSQLISLAGADPGRPLDPADFTGDQVRNVNPADEYQRPGIEVWSALAGGVALADAVTRGRARAQNLAATDLQLASTNIAQARFEESPHVVGYERVPAGDHTCTLCLVASTQRYNRGDLMPIHPGCSCDVAPIVGSDDPGRVLDQGLLDQTRAAVRDTYGAGVDVNDPAVLVAVHDHGEYGPTLTQAGQHFTDAAAIAAA